MDHIRRAFAWASRLDTFLSVLERAVILGAATAAVAAVIAGIVGGDPLRFVGLAVIAAWILMLLVVLWGRRDSQAREGPYQRFGSEWASKNQDGHWNGIREMATAVRDELSEAVGKPSVTHKELTNLRARTESLEVQAAAYEEVWGIGDSFWHPRNRRKWETTQRFRKDAPSQSWALPLWKRVDYTLSWIYGHNPETRPPPGYEYYDPWTGWSDMGS